jgi:hypothetical protein
MFGQAVLAIGAICLVGFVFKFSGDLAKSRELAVQEAERITATTKLVIHWSGDLAHRISEPGILDRVDSPLDVVDPWGNNLTVEYVKDCVVVRSAGPDGIAGNRDDVYNSAKAWDGRTMTEYIQEAGSDLAKRATRGVTKGIADGLKDAIKGKSTDKKSGDAVEDVGRSVGKGAVNGLLEGVKDSVTGK